jgi:hypothetical protein
MAPTSSPPRAASGVAGGAFCRGAAHLQALAAPTALDDRKTDACFVVRDAQRAGARLRLFRGWELDRRSAVHLTSSRATARRIAANIAELPELLKRLRPQGLVRPAGFERVGQPPM